jgi:phosphoglycerate dehydrogenase-like enzyme
MKIFCFLGDNAGKWMDARMPDGWEYVIASRKRWGDAFETRVKEELKNSDFMLVGMQPITEELLGDCKQLKLIQRFGVGYDNVDLGAAAARGIPVANVAGVTSVSVAEYTICVILSALRRIPLYDGFVRSGEWHGGLATDENYELCGRTVGIVGFGAIGQALARRLIGFGVKTLYNDMVSAPRELEAELHVEKVTLDELLAQSDIVTLHVPLTGSTRNMIGKEQIAKMKPTAYLIAAARGGVVDEAALAQALNDGRLAGAAIDVFAEEPLPAGHPLTEARNTVLTPHIAGPTHEMQRRVFDFAFENFKRVEAGERPLCVVNDI